MPWSSSDMQPNLSVCNGANERPSTSKTEASEAPTLIRQFPQEPKYLDRNYDRTGGSEAATWRHKFVRVIESHTSEMSTDERTEFFEACITRNKDRYIQTFAAYYGQHPEHIPDRPGGVKSTKQERDGMLETPEIGERQKTLFNAAWIAANTGASPFDQDRSFLVDTLAGPKDEANPHAEQPTCKHCILEARKEKWRNPLATLGRLFSTKLKSQPISNPTPQQDVATTTSSISLSSTAPASSFKSSLKSPPLPRVAPHTMMPPTGPAQHIEQKA